MNRFEIPPVWGRDITGSAFVWEGGLLCREATSGHIFTAELAGMITAQNPKHLLCL